MPKVKQITVWVADRPGVLGDVASTLGEAKINIQAFLAHVSGDEGAIRLIVDKPAAAKKALTARGWRATEEEVVALTLADKPGTLGAAADKLGGTGINIRYAYTGSVKGGKVNAYFAVPDATAALKALR
ncbi:MAG TPA: ACT domain-containing protein [Terriglobales bacterium]|nr:ACT domain-containing protein [Terriglobales bacterium]